MNCNTALTPARWMAVGVTVLAGTLLAPPVHAAAILEFDQGGLSGGTMSWDGVVVTASGIQFKTLTASGTDFNSGETLTCQGCELSFTSGLVDSVEPDGDVTFQAGGEFIMRGTLVANPLIFFDGLNPGDPSCDGAVDCLILSGTFATGAELTFFGSDADASAAFNARGPDTKNQVILDFFFGPGAGDVVFTFTSGNFTVPGVSPGLFEFEDIDDADLVNRVPEPGATTLLFLGAGLVAVFRRRN